MPGEVTDAVRLLAEAAAMPHGPTKVAIVEEATRRADIAGDLDLAFRARTDLADASEFGGAPEKTLVAFAWLLSKIDEHPGRFNEWRTLWTYKWAVTSLLDFAAVPLAEVWRAIDDLEERFTRQGAGPRAAAKLRWRAGRAIGDLDEARRYLAIWRGTNRDFLSDCAACDAAESAECQLALGEVDAALKSAQPVFAGRLACREVPHDTLAHFLLPLVDRDDGVTARSYHERGYELVRRNPEFTRAIGEHMAYLAVTADLGRATSLLERHMPWVVPSADTMAHLRFHLGARLLLAVLADHGDVEVRVPVGMIADKKSQRLAASDVLDIVEAELDRLVAAFDHRNGNTYYADLRAAYQARAEAAIVN